MVNVPGRSKGCNTCRRRKKGCDLQKPECARCIRDGLQCEGYTRSTIFVSHEPRTTAGSTKVAAIRPKTDAARRQETAEASTTSITPLREDLVNVAFQQQIFSQFWEAALPKGSMLPPEGCHALTSYAWADEVLRLAVTSAPLRQALSAISLSCIGNRERDPVKTRYGAECYGAAVIKLNNLLQANAANTDEGIIPTCQLLSSYEQFNAFGSTKGNAQGRNWQAHTAGIARLLQLRGPQRQTAGNSLAIYSQARLPQLAYWLAVRKKCPFEDETWRVLPWEGVQKTVRDKLFDVALKVPGLLERCDVANVAGNEELQIPLVRDCLNFHQQLEDWRSESMKTLWEADPNNQGREVDWTVVQDPGYFMLHGMDVGISITLYWAVNTILCGTLRILSQRVAQGHKVDTFAGDQFDPTVSATNIVRFMQPFMGADAGLIGFQAICFPMGAALMYFAAFNAIEPPERETIRKQICGATSVKPYGPMIGAFLHQLQEEEAKRWDVEHAAKQLGRWEGDQLRSKSWFTRQLEPVPMQDILIDPALQEQ